jgi:hypothetical protein
LIKCILGLAIMSVCKKKRKPRVDATVLTNYN